MATFPNREPGPVVGHLQTDTFCPHCGYNLVTQAVLKDDRLEILVVRCPECGKFTAAGQGTTTGKVWMDRFAKMVLGNWVLFVLVVFGGCTFFMGLVAYGHLRTFTQLVEKPRQMPGISPGPAGYIYAPRLADPSDPIAMSEMRWQVATLCGLAIGLGLFAGGFFSIFLWHAHGWRRRLALLMPLVGCAVTAGIWIVDPMAISLWNWGLTMIACYFAIEMLGVMFGSLAGRPVARVILKLVLPPKPRQHFAFLWAVDRKQLAMD